MHAIAKYLAATAALVNAAAAHMVMATPPPYGSPDNSPLESSGSNFPCKATSSAGGPVTNVAVGSSLEVSFKGSAVHGGGSCQFAVTPDNPATKSSKWQVLLSVEGGCPASATGNLGGGPDSTSDASKFSVKIPPAIKAGTYSFSWTWYNRIGNREIYQNCATIHVTGGGSAKRSYDNETMAIPELDARDAPLPPLFIGNMPPEDCLVKEGTSLAFPQPGSNVQKLDKELAPPSGPKCGASSPGSSGTDASSGGSASGGSSGSANGGSSSGSAGAQSSTPSGSVDVAANPSAATTSQSSTPANGAGADASAQSSAPAAAPSNPAQGSTSQDTASQGAASQGSGSPAAGATSCTQPGQVVCGQGTIGICDQSLKAVMTPLPAGTVCGPNGIAWPRERRSFRMRI